MFKSIIYNIYLLHLRAPGQLWMRFWMVGCEKPKKSAPDGTMGATDVELKTEFIKVIKCSNF